MCHRAQKCLPWADTFPISSKTFCIAWCYGLRFPNVETPTDGDELWYGIVKTTFFLRMITNMTKAGAQLLRDSVVAIALAPEEGRGITQVCPQPRGIHTSYPTNCSPIARTGHYVLHHVRCSCVESILSGKREFCELRECTLEYDCCLMIIVMAKAGNTAIC